MRVKVEDIATLNASQKKYKGIYTEIQYLDTSSVEEGRILGFQKLNVENDEIPSRAQRAVKDGTIVISSVRPNLRHYAFFRKPDDNIIVSSGFVTVDARENIVDSEYLYYALTSSQATTYLVAIASTAVSSYPSFSPEDLGNYQIEIPESLDDQKKIAKVLSDIDSKIANNSVICSDLEGMAKLIYDYWFVQFDFPDENGKPYKSSGGKMVWNEELKREIPDGWEVKRLGTLIDHNRGISYTGKSFSKDGTPIISLASIDRSGRYIPDGIKYYNQEYAHSKVVKPFDLVMANTDMTQERAVMGKIIFVPDIFDGDILTTHHITQIHTDELLKAYLMMTTQTDWFHNYIKGFSSGTNVLGMDMIGFEDYLLIIPEKTILRRFNEVIYGIYNRIFSNIRENQELASLRDFLLPMLMNGQVKVKKGENQ